MNIMNANLQLHTTRRMLKPWQQWMFNSTCSYRGRWMGDSVYMKQPMEINNSLILCGFSLLEVEWWRGGPTCSLAISDGRGYRRLSYHLWNPTCISSPALHILYNAARGECTVIMTKLSGCADTQTSKCLCERGKNRLNLHLASSRTWGVFS